MAEKTTKGATFCVSIPKAARGYLDDLVEDPSNVKYATKAAIISEALDEWLKAHTEVVDGHARFISGYANDDADRTAAAAKRSAAQNAAIKARRLGRRRL